MNNTATVLADPGAERAVLGAILIDPTRLTELAARLQPADFWLEAHQVIYAAMLTLHQQQRPVDFVTLADALEQGGNFDQAGGPANLTDLVIHTPTSLHAEHYAAIVLEHRLKRDLVGAAERIARLAYDPGCSSSAAISQAQAALETVTARQPAPGLIHIKHPTAEVIDQVEAAAQAGVLTSGIPTGFTQLDRLLAGLQRQDLIYLGARPGMGKTSLALSIAQHVARQDQPVAVFSLEMSKEQLVQRLLATNARIDTQRIRLGQLHETEWAALLEAANFLHRLPLYLDDTPSATLFNLRASCHRLMAETGPLALVVVDYIQLMSAVGRQENRQQEISVISRGLKALAREIDAPLLVISQLSRALETRAEKQPVLSDLKESGSLEQDADVVLFLYRDDYYDEASTQPNLADVIVAKHRKGATGKVQLFFRKELTSFHDLVVERTELEY